MDTNWLPDALAAEAKEYSMAKAPAHEPWEPPAKQQQARPLVKRPQEAYREAPLTEDDEAEEEEPAYVPEIREYEMCIRDRAWPVLRNGSRLSLLP